MGREDNVLSGLGNRLTREEIKCRIERTLENIAREQDIFSEYTKGQINTLKSVLELFKEYK